MLKRLLSCLENICAVCLCILTFSVFFQIIARTILHIPATWTVEVGRAMFLIIIFLEMPKLIYYEGEMAVTMIRDFFQKSRPVLLAFYIIKDVFVYFFLVTLLYGSFDRMRNEWTSVIPTVEWMTYGYLYLVMFAGTVFMLYAKVLHTKNYITGKYVKED